MGQKKIAVCGGAAINQLNRLDHIVMHAHFSPLSFVPLPLLAHAVGLPQYLSGCSLVFWREWVLETASRKAFGALGIYPRASFGVLQNVYKTGGKLFF